MRVNKHIIWPLLTATALFVSCLQETDSDAPEMQLQARIEGSAETRVDFDEASGVFFWADGDRIDIHTSAGAYRTVTVNAAGKVNLSTLGSETRNGYAVYPAGIVKDETPLAVMLPANYDIEGSMDTLYPVTLIAENNPTSNELLFYHAGALIQLILNEVPASTKSIIVTVDKRITGDFTVANPGTETPTITTDDEEEGKSVTFTLATALSELTDGFVLNVPVPVGTYSTLKVEMKNTGGGSPLKTYTYDKERICARAHGRKAAFPQEVHRFGPVSGNKYKNVDGMHVIWFDGHAAQSGSVQIDSYKSADGGLTKTSVPLEIVAYATADENGFCNEDWTTEIPSGLTGVTITDRNQQQKYLNVSISEQTEKTVNRELVEHAQNLKSRTPAKDLDLALYDPTNLRTPRASGKPRTANCYVVNRPGTYKFPVVYGNAVDWEKEPTTGCNTDAYIFNNSTQENTINFFYHFPRFDDNLITSPYILEDVGLTVDDVEAVVVWEDVPSAAYSMLTLNPAVTEAAVSGYCGLNGTQLSTVPYISFDVPVGTIDPDEEKDPCERVTGIRQGNIVIALRTSRDLTVAGNPVEAGTILWSWHIWITDKDLTPLPTLLRKGSAFVSDELMPENLGWCDTKVVTRWHDRAWFVKLRQTEGELAPIVLKVIQKGEKEGLGSCGTFYQWGRKDPFLPSTGTGNLNKPVYSPIGRTLTASESAVSWSDEPSNGPSTAIQHPETIYYVTLYNMPHTGCAWGGNQPSWMAGARPWNLWCVTNSFGYNDNNNPVPAEKYSKSVYDPCPPGFGVPHLHSFTFFVRQPGQGDYTNSPYAEIVDINQDGAKNSGDFDEGFWFWTGFGDSMVYFPASGQRNFESGQMVGVNTTGYYNLYTAGNQSSGRKCIFNKDYIRCWNSGDPKCAAVRPIREK